MSGAPERTAKGGSSAGPKWSPRSVEPRGAGAPPSESGVDADFYIFRDRS